MTDLNSRPYKPDPAKCCEACIFGRGEHSGFCPSAEGLELADEQTIAEILATAGL